MSLKILDTIRDIPAPDIDLQTQRKPKFYLTGIQSHDPNEPLEGEEPQAFSVATTDEESGIIQIAHFVKAEEYRRCDLELWGIERYDDGEIYPLAGVGESTDEFGIEYDIDVNPLIDRMIHPDGKPNIPFQRFAGLYDLGPIPSSYGALGIFIARHKSLRITPELRKWMRNEGGDTQFTLAVVDRSDFIPTKEELIELWNTQDKNKTFFQIGLETHIELNPDLIDLAYSANTSPTIMGECIF